MEDLVGCARYLLDRPTADQTQADLRRAQSTLYYALFHELAACCADLIAGPRSGPHSGKAWMQCFRALEHGHSRKQCLLAAGANYRFPPDIKDFANLFATLQIKRHRADYSPDCIVDVADVAQTIASVTTTIVRFRNCPEPDKRAFCALVILKNRAD